MDDNNVVEVKQTVEVLDNSGNTMQRGDSPLSGIFDKIEAGKNEGKTAQDVLKTEPKPEVKQPDAKKTEPVKEPVKQESDLDKKLEEKKPEVTDGSRKGLFEELEARSKEKQQKEESKKEEADSKKDVKADDKKAEDDVAEEELQVLPHDKPKTAKRIQALLKRIEAVTNEATNTKKEAKEKADKLAEYEKKLAEVKTLDPKVEEEIKKQKDELAMFRRRYDLDKDPEVKTRFDGRIESAQKSIMDTLSKAGLGAGLLDVIKEHGGWGKFAESNTPLTLKDGKVAPAFEVADSILQLIPLAQRKAIEAAMVEEIQTKREKERYFQEEQAKANDYFKKLDEQQVKSRQEQEAQVKQIAATIENWHKDVVAKNDWLKEKAYPENATPQQKAAIDEENRYTKQLNQVLKKSLNVSDVNESLEIIFDSVRFYQERREKNKLASEVETLRKELAAKQTEIDKFKGASRTTNKPGSIATSAQDKVTGKDKIPQGIEAAFDAISRGQSVSADDDGE